MPALETFQALMRKPLGVDENERLALSPATTLFLVDIDGVLTEPFSKKPNTTLLNHITETFAPHAITILNTGRSVQWALEKVLIPWASLSPTPLFWQRFALIAEKGAVSLVRKNGEYSFSLDTEPQWCVPSTIKEEVERLSRQVQPPIISYDSSKLAMCTLEFEARPELLLDDEARRFATLRPQLVQKLESIIAKHQLAASLTVEESVIAVDIEHIEAGKALGGKKAFDVARDLGLKNVQEFLAIGDSPSDVTMLSPFLTHQAKKTFLYCGELPLHHDHHQSSEIDVVQSVHRYDAAALELLRNRSPQ